MTEAKHTPGTWRVVKVTGKPQRRILGEKGEVLATVYNRKEFQQGGGGEMKANAALISASPMMFAALERSHGALQSLWQILHAQGIAGSFQKSIDVLMQENTDALAKARGAK